MAEQLTETPIDAAQSLAYFHELQSQQSEIVVRHRPGMIAQHGPHFFQIHKHAEMARRPKRIITGDGPNPHEIDDGVFVEELPTATEMYRVGVCLPDTSRLLRRHDVLAMAMGTLHAEYGVRGEEGGYLPYIPERFIRGYEMSQGNERDALVLRFVVGQNQPPTDVSVSFEKVYIERNLDYRQLTEMSRPSKQYERYARAGRYLLDHMHYIAGEDAQAVVQADTVDMVRQLVDLQPERLHVAGPTLTAGMMIAANSLGQKVLQDAGRVQINRVFNPESTDFDDFLPHDVASFSLTPSKHVGLGLQIAQITSPLRRIQDGINGLQHWKLAKGLRQDRGDIRLMQEVTRLLNFEIMGKQVDKRIRAKYVDRSDSYVDGAIAEQLDELKAQQTA